jgi:hypothetical protein
LKALSLARPGRIHRFWHALQPPAGRTLRRRGFSDSPGSPQLASSVH